MVEDNSTEKSIGAIEANITNLGNNFTQLSKDIREYAKDNREAHIRLHEKTDELQDDLTTSETDFNISMTKMSESIMLKFETTDGNVADLQKDNEWHGRIWKGVCALLIPVVVYIVVQLLDHVGG